MPFSLISSTRERKRLEIVWFVREKIPEHKTRHLCVFTRVGGGGPGNIAGDIPLWKGTINRGPGHMVTSTVNCPKIMKKNMVFLLIFAIRRTPRPWLSWFFKKKSLSTDLLICALLRPTRGGDPEIWAGIVGLESKNRIFGVYRESFVKPWIFGDFWLLG